MTRQQQVPVIGHEQYSTTGESDRMLREDGELATGTVKAKDEDSSIAASMRPRMARTARQLELALGAEACPDGRDSHRT